MKISGGSHSEEIVTRTNEEKQWFTATLAARSFISCGLCHGRFYRGVLLRRLSLKNFIAATLACVMFWKLWLV